MSTGVPPAQPGSGQTLYHDCYFVCLEQNLVHRDVELSPCLTSVPYPLFERGCTAVKGVESQRTLPSCPTPRPRWPVPSTRCCRPVRTLQVRSGGHRPSPATSPAKYPRDGRLRRDWRGSHCGEGAGELGEDRQISVKANPLDASDSQRQ